MTGVLALSQQEGPDSRSQTLSAILTFIVLGQTSCLGSAQSNSELTISTKHKSTSVSLCLFLPPSLSLVRRLASGVKAAIHFLLFLLSESESAHHSLGEGLGVICQSVTLGVTASDYSAVLFFRGVRTGPGHFTIPTP